MKENRLQRQAAAALQPPGLTQVPSVVGPSGLAAILLPRLDRFMWTLTCSTEEEFLWDIVREHIEPVSVLRATVSRWAEDFPATQTVVDTAHNLLLLLDPELLGDQRAETPAKLQCPADIEPSRPTIQHTVLSIEGALPFLTLASPPPLRHLRHPAAFLCDRPGMPCLATCLEGVLGG